MKLSNQGKGGEGSVYLGAYEVFSLIALLALSMANVAAIEYSVESSDAAETVESNVSIPLDIDPASDASAAAHGQPDPFQPTHRLVRMENSDAGQQSHIIIIEIEEPLPANAEFRLRIKTADQSHEIQSP